MNKNKPVKAPKGVPGRWAKFAHLSPYAKNNSKQGVRIAHSHGYRAIDLDFNTCWNDDKTERILINTHWGHVGKEFHDPKGKIGPHEYFHELTISEVRRLRSKRGHYRINTIDEMLIFAHSLGMRVEIELKDSPGLGNVHVLEPVHDFVKQHKINAQVKTLSNIGNPWERLHAAKEAGFKTILLPRGSRRFSKKHWDVVDYVRGPCRWY